MSDKKRPLKKAVESAEVEVPFDVYQQNCSKCSYLLEMLTPHSQYMKQLSRWVDEREPIKILCSGYARCVHPR